MDDRFGLGPRTSRRGLMTWTAAGLASVALAPLHQAAAAAGAYDWESLPWGGGGFIDGFLYHPKEKGLLYTRTDVGGAYRFDPVGKRWIPLLDHLGPDEGDLMGVLAMAIDPNDASRLYLACGEYLGEWSQDGAVLCSSDRGATWTKTVFPKGFKLGGNADGRGTGERLMVDPNDGDILFLGSSQDGLFKSTDAGRSFRKLRGFPSKSCSLVLIDGRRGKAGTPSDTIYVGSQGQDGGLYKSTDGGASFSLMPGLPKLMPQRAALDAEGNLYVTLSDGGAPAGGKAGGVYRLDASASGWKDISPMKPGVSGNPGFGYCGLDLDAATPGTIIASTMNRWGIGDDIYISRDRGETWKALGARSRHNAAGYPWLVSYLKGEDRMGHWIADVKIDPFNPDAMIYGTGYGLWMTAGLGQIDGQGEVQFDFVQDGLEETVALDMAAPKAGPRLYVAMGDVAGGAYDALDKGPQRDRLFLPVTETNRTVDFAELSQKRVVRTSEGAATGGYYSPDAGASWTPFATTPHVRQNAKKEWRGVGRICISAGGTGLLWAPEKQGVFYSRDMGKTWKPSEGLPGVGDFTFPIAADRAVDGVFYLHDRASNKILASSDFGATFLPTITGVPKLEGYQASSLVAVAGQLRDLWLLTSIGLFHSKNVSSPLVQIKGVETAWHLSVGAAAPGKTYGAVYLNGRIKGQAGLWRSDDVGATWVRINDDRRQFGALRTMAADPREYGVLYIGPHGRGVMVGRQGPS